MSLVFVTAPTRQGGLSGGMALCEQIESPSETTLKTDTCARRSGEGAKNSALTHFLIVKKFLIESLF